MQSNIISRMAIQPSMLSIKSNTGLTTQVRHHVKMYPWRANRDNRECYLDPTRTPYTDKHNINEFKAAKRQRKDWQRVIYKNKDARFNAYKLNDSYKSDPVEAKETSQSRLSRFESSLRDRGSARESVPYEPPEQVQERIIAIYKAILLQSQSDNELATSNSDTDILSVNLDQSRPLKFNLITKCIEEFQHDLPNSYLTDIQVISDLVEYYSTPVRGVNPYTALLRREELPVNLSLISEPLRYNQESDEFFGGHNALPGIVSKIPGLRGAKKYPILNQKEFQWPDI